MAQKIRTVYIDDLDGRESNEVNTHSFALDGVLYEIDLVPENYDRLYEALEPFINAGRKAGRAKKGVRAVRSVPSSGPTAEQIRLWAREHGHQVSDRGRISASIREAYERVH